MFFDGDYFSNALSINLYVFIYKLIYYKINGVKNVSNRRNSINQNGYF